MRPIWLVGEQNPYSSWQRNGHKYDLYDEPANATGARLRTKILDVSPAIYYDEARFIRRNLLDKGERWTVRNAREAAELLRREIDRAPTVLLGAKVAAAFGLDTAPFVEHSILFGYQMGPTPWRVLVLPHPSGLCRAWNQPGAFERARAAVAALEKS